MIYGWNPHDPGGQRRQRMIDETSAWLTWALRAGVELPRIPRARVDEGGFARLLKAPGARAAVAHWWNRTLEIVGSVGSRS